MNVWEIIGWWLKNALIFWGAAVVVCSIDYVKWVRKNDHDGKATEILDIAIDDFFGVPKWAEGFPNLYKWMDFAVDIIAWPVRTIMFLITWVKLEDRARELRAEMDE